MIVPTQNCIYQFKMIVHIATIYLFIVVVVVVVVVVIIIIIIIIIIFTRYFTVPQFKI